MILDDDGARVDLRMLHSWVKDAIGGVQWGFEELGELGRNCKTAVEQSGNQAAWQYVDLLSMKMEEMSKRLAKDSQELHKWLEERDRYNDWLEKDRNRHMEELRHLLEDEKIK